MFEWLFVSLTDITVKLTPVCPLVQTVPARVEGGPSRGPVEGNVARGEISVPTQWPFVFVNQMEIANNTLPPCTSPTLQAFQYAPIR